MPNRSLARGAKVLPLAALGAILAWAAWERFRLPLTPCADGDLRAYLGPGLSQLTGKGFVHLYGQCFLYPGIVWAILWAGGDFRWITAVGGGAGLATGAALYGCWRQLRGLFPASRLPPPVHDLAGAALAGLYLFSSPLLHLERGLRPEAVFPLFATLNIYFVLRFLRDRFVEARPRRAVLWGSGAAFLSVAAWLLKPSFAAMFLLANLPLLISLLRPGASARQKLALAAWPAVAAGALLILPEARLRAGDPARDAYLAHSLFSIHADIINEQLAEDAARPAGVPYPAMFLSAAHEKLSGMLAEDRASHSRYWPVLGFNPDYLLAGPESFSAWLYLILGEPREAEFCRFYYWRSMRRRPAAMAAKIGRQFACFYRFGGCPVYPPEYRQPVSGFYRRSLESAAGMPELLDYPPAREFLARTRSLTAARGEAGPFPRAEAAGRGLGRCYLAGLLLTVGLAGVPALRGRAAVGMFLYSYNFGTVLALAIGHTLDVGRYSEYQLAYTLLPQFATLWLVAELLAAGVHGGWAAGDGRRRPGGGEGTPIRHPATKTRRIWRTIGL